MLYSLLECKCEEKVISNWNWYGFKTILQTLHGNKSSNFSFLVLDITNPPKFSEVTHNFLSQ